MPPLRSSRSVPTEAQPALDAMALDQPSIQRNVTIEGQRTSVRLRSVEWDALVEIAQREGRTISDVAAEIDHRRGAASLAAALRVFAIGYFKILAAHRETDGFAVPTPKLLLRPADQP
jgi:predicted DNA-binding ribbon-helix-helix protein